MQRFINYLNTKLILVVRWRHWKSVFRSLTIISTVFSMLLVYFTLKEMQIQRDRSYAPDIIFEECEISFSWIGNENPNQSIIPSKDDEESNLFKLNVLNVGVGVAKNIRISLDVEKALQPWADILNKEVYENNDYYFENDDGTLYIKDENKRVGSNALVKWDKLYLLPNATESGSFIVSPLFPVVIKEIIINGKYSFLTDHPITIDLEFEDIQGKQYRKSVKFGIQVIFREEDDDGNGHAIYRIAME